MDANKLTKLRALGYKIRPCCELCKQGLFLHDSWGACRLHQYLHLKHTGPARPLSVHKLGWCPQWELDPTKTAGLAAFAEFLGP